MSVVMWLRLSLQIRATEQRCIYRDFDMSVSSALSHGPQDDVADKEQQDASGQPKDGKSDPMRIIFLRCDLLRQLSLLILNFRAVSRDALDIHSNA